MAATFRPVNPNLVAETIREDVMTPSSSATPRPNTAPHPHPAMSPEDATTPTRATFSSGAAGQKPLPTSPFPQAVQVPDAADRPRRDNSQHSAKSSSRRDSMDIDMDDSDGEGNADDGAGSDDESVNADGTESNKKKKSQRFYCTDYPPCSLSFTRSEHLARHIRKHTGERPFQCHCSRRFSRLDNLRQHAQTVHVNEDIPMDSLAATGSRFQRQIRTERVRQAGSRARASTGGSAGGPSRGHSKSLSTSSIASISSVGSSYSTQADTRRRPPPLVMAADPRSRLSLESYRSAADSTYSYRPASPSDFSTPTSATFSTAQSSPRWASGMASPTSTHSRSQSMYTTGNRTPGRRLSVPSGANPFQSPRGHVPGRPVFGPGPVNSSHPAAFASSNSSMVTSPTVSTSGWSTRRDSTSSATDEGWRRRTWHPDSRSYNGQPHQLSAVGNQAVRPNPPPPIANPSNPQTSFRLPGIESFDPVPRRNPSPMAVDSEHVRRPVYQPPPTEAMQPEERRNLNMYDASLQRGLTRLDINHKTPPRDSAGAWASEVNKAVLAQAEHVRQNPPTVRFQDQLPPSRQNPSAGAGRSLHQQTMSAPSIATSRESKRHGWYQGPVMPQGNAPGPQDPRVAHVDRIVHPNLNGFSGFPSREQQVQQQQQQQQDRPANADPLRRLEALVAVATGEGSTATAY
ncbi:Biofilm and cell wall regulator 1 [Tolypocladium ophioglossoides CBS 100239]|uniref:Biofilm and cell wall regulator 1 n=1 Tax=Tolypocladium ophioglossoides (strain CBS 100239) TaxID=1163406 RepID=A0A0L0N5J1_TOLOC|nr:Biofilm and cell wall regulator 1 [Tolypocladium ophioglossoides CBS 100239]